MKKGLIIILAVVLIVIIIVASFAGSYNSLVSMDEGVKAALSAIDTDLQRRSDLIPNLVETVKGFAAHEKEVVDSVTTARAQMAGAGTIAEKAAADQELSGALSRLLVVVENYPDLKANENFLALQHQLEGTENRIAVSRKDYNNAAGELNKSIRRFPTNIIAGMFGFQPAEYFEADESSREVPEVKF